MADPKRQAAFEELMRRGVIKTPEQREAVVELARRGLLRTTPYASFESTKTPAAAATKPGQTAKPKAAAKHLDTYRGTGASMRAAPPPEMSFLDRAVAVLNIPRAALLAMPNALDALRRSQEGRELLARDPEGRKVEANLLKMSYPERVKYFAEGGTADPAQARARQEATATLGKLGRAGSVAMEFGAQAATDPLTWVTGGGSAVAKSVPQVVGKIVKDSAKAGRIARPLTRAAQAANVGAAGALTAQQLATGVPQVIEGVKRGSVEQTTAGVLATAFGTLAAIGTVHGLRQWQADTGVKLTPQQEQVILKAPPKNRPNIAKRFAKIQEARAKDVPTRMPPVTPTPVEAAPVPAKTTKARKPKAQKAAPTEKPDHELTPEQFTSKHINSVNGASVIQQLGLDGARKFYADQHRMIVEDARQRGLKTSEPLPAVGDNQPLGNEAAAPQPAPVGSAGRGDAALSAEPVPTPQAEAVPPVQRGLETGAEAAPEAALTRQDVTAQATSLRNRLNEFHKRQPSLLPDPRNERELSLYDTSDNKRIREGRLKTYREAVYLGIEEDIVALSRQGRVIPEIYEAIRARVPGLSLSDLQEMVPTVRRAHNLDVADPIRPPEKMRQDIPPTLSLSEKVIALTQQIRTLPYEQLLELQKTPAYREIADMPAHFIPRQLVEGFQSAIEARIIERRNIQAGREHAAIPTIDTNPQESAQVTARAQMEKASAQTGLTPSQHAYLVQKLGQVRDTQSPDPVRIPVPGDGEFTVTGKQAGALIKSLPKAPEIPKAATPVQPLQAPVAAPPENGLHTIRLTDFLAEAGEKGLDLTDAMRLHKAAVQQALDAGLPVDKAVLKPYPGMKKGGAANAVPQQETAGGLLRQAEAGAGAGVGLPRVGGQDRPIETAGEGQAQAAQVAPQVEPTISEAIQHFESIPKDRSTAPDSLPLYGANGEEVARKYFLPADYYEERNGLQVIASKYRTPEYNAALQAWEKLHSSANTREPRFLRPAETRLRTEQRKIEDAARKTLLPQALPPVETPPLQTPTAKLPETRKITDEMRAFADEMEAEAKKRLGSGLSARIDAGLFDYAIIGAMKLLRKSLDFADWSAEMVAEHGEKIKPHLQDIWEAAHEYYNNAVRRRFPELPELTLPKTAQAAEKPDAPKGNTAQPSLRHRDMQAIAAELGVGLDPKITESWQRVTDRALKEYDSILSTLKHYDPDTSPTPTDEEKIVAGARIGEIRRELNPLLAKKENVTKEEAARITALELESGQLLNLVTKAGSGSARSLNLQKLLLPDDPTDPAAVLLRAQRLAGGELSIPARRTLTRLAEEAKTATDAATARVTRRQKGEATAQEETPVKALSPSFGRQNKIFTKDKFEAAQARLKEKLNRASSGLDPTLLADLVEIGGFYFEGRIRQFGAWAARLRQDWPALTEADLQRVWIHVKANKSLAQGQRSVPKPQTFVEELARRVGNENARAIVDTLEEKQPGLLEKLIQGSRLSEAEQTLVGQTYLSHTRQRAGTAPLTHSQAMQSIQAAANAMRPKTPRKPSQRPVQAAKPTELTGNPEKDFRAALSRRMGAKMADSFMAELKQAGLLQRLLNGESLTGLQARQVDALNQKYTLERQKAGYQGKAMDAFRAALTDARAQARQEAAALRKAQAAHEKNRPAATTRTQSQRDFDRAQAANIRIMQRAKDTLSNLGRDAKKRGTNPLLDDATLAYAKGARDLHRFTAALRKKHEGTTFTEAELNKLFREAAEQYHKDFRQVEAIKRQMTEVVAKEVYRQKPWYGKIWHGAKELNNLSRSLILGPDISFLLRQGGPLVVNRFGHMNKKALPEMWRALQREEVAQAIDASIRHGANGDIYEKAGLDFSDIEPGTKPGQEEGIASDWLQKVPGVRRPYRAADRANTVLINKIRAESFDLLYDPQKHNLEQAKAIARYINVATGRGDLSNAAIAGLVRGTADVFLSPRYMVSRFQYLIGLPLWKAPKGARKLIAKEYANYYLRVGLFLGLASQIPGVEVEADPRSSDFATVRIGDVNIDILSGLKQPVTMSARVLPLGEWGHKNFLTEEKKAIPIDPFRTFLNFFLYKMSPLPQLGADVALRQGKDFKGDPLTVGGVSRRLFLNITAQDVVEALLEKGIDPKTALELTGSALASQVGVGANLRDRAEEARKRAQKAEARKEAAREKNQVDRIMQRLTDPIVPNVPGGVLTGAGTF